MAIPDRIFQGSTVTFDLDLDDYSSADYDILLVCYNDQFTFTIDSNHSSVDGLGWDVTVPLATSDGYVPGEYSWDLFVVATGVRLFVQRGSLTVEPDVSELNKHDGRSHVKKVLDALRAVIERKATTDQLSYSIRGRSLQRMSMEEIIKAESHYARLYRDELDAEKVATGKTSKNIIRVRFG